MALDKKTEMALEFLRSGYLAHLTGRVSKPTPVEVVMKKVYARLAKMQADEMAKTKEEDEKRVKAEYEAKIKAEAKARINEKGNINDNASNIGKIKSNVRKTQKQKEQELRSGQSNNSNNKNLGRKTSRGTSKRKR